MRILIALYDRACRVARREEFGACRLIVAGKIAFSSHESLQAVGRERRTSLSRSMILASLQDTGDVSGCRFTVVTSVLLGDGEARESYTGRHRTRDFRGAHLPANQGARRYLGNKLYEARGGRVRLTPSGERTMEKAISIFQKLENFERTVASGEESVDLTLCTHDALLRYLISGAVMRFSQKHPLARLRLLTRSVENNSHLVRTNERDYPIGAPDY